MKTNKIYAAVALLAMLTLLLPGKSIFAKGETSGRERGDRDEIRTRVPGQDDDDEDKARTGTTRRDDEDEDEEEDEAEMRSSTVASFVKKLLEVADRNKGGIGEEVRVVAREQEQEKEKVFEAIEEVKNRSWLKTFLIGADYKNIGMIRSEIVKTQNRLDKLNRLLETMTTSTGAITTTEQIRLLTEAQIKLEDFLEQNESKFSLFGWLVKLFNR